MMNEQTFFDVLFNIGIHSEVYFCGTMRKNWEISTTGENHGAFHIIKSNYCWLETQTKEKIKLNKNDIVIFHQDAQYVIYSNSEEEKDTDIICGLYKFTKKMSSQFFLNVLPQYIHIEANKNTRLLKILDAIYIETSNTENIEKNIILNKLSEIIFIHAIYEVCNSNFHINAIVRTLKSKRISTVLLAVIDDIGNDWPVKKMADLANMSQASFYRNFKEILNITPNTLLSHLRMDKAQQLLSQSNMSTREIAFHLGYKTEGSFRKKFKKFINKTPGQFKKEQLTIKDGTSASIYKELLSLL